MRYLFNILLILCFGCATKPSAPVTPAALMPPVIHPASHVALPRDIVRPFVPVTNTLTFVYPNDVTNHTWYLQQNPHLEDLSGWQTIDGPFQGVPGTGPGSNGVTLFTTNRQMFFRMFANP